MLIRVGVSFYIHIKIDALFVEDNAKTMLEKMVEWLSVYAEVLLVDWLCVCKKICERVWSVKRSNELMGCFKISSIVFVCKFIVDV